MRQGLALCAVLLQGCVLAPNTIRLETVHESHIIQHTSLADRNSHYGRDGVDLRFKWSHGPVVAEFSEGYTFHGNDGSPAPREIFEARFGYEWKVK
jgi:hypothetical protein